MSCRIYPVKILPCFWALVLAIIAVTGCSRGDGITPATDTAPVSPAATSSPLAPSATPFQPSPTPLPLAAEVNGEGIPLAVFQAELARYQAGVGAEITPEVEARVLENLIYERLLAQAARAKGFEVGEGLLDERIAQLGDQQTLASWMSAHGYQEAEFRQALEQAIAAAWMRDQIVAAVPETADQIHARQILFDTLEDAQLALDSLKRGGDFSKLAAQYDPVIQGDLGWFPQGYLTDAKLDEAIFNLEPGQMTDIIQTAIGFHILQVLERDEIHPLTPDARRVLQSQALQTWLEDRLSQSNVTVMEP